MYVIRAFNQSDNFVKKFFLRQKYYVTAIVNQNITSMKNNI